MTDKKLNSDNDDDGRVYLHRGYLRDQLRRRKCLLYRKWNGLWQYQDLDGSWVEAGYQDDSRYVEVALRDKGKIGG